MLQLRNTLWYWIAVLGVSMMSPPFGLAYSGDATTFGLLSEPICQEILEQTYGALNGWHPSDKQLTKMCRSVVLAGGFKELHGTTKKQAHQLCNSFVTVIRKTVGDEGERKKAPHTPFETAKLSWCAPTLVQTGAKLETDAPPEGVLTTNNLLYEMERQEAMQTRGPSVEAVLDARNRVLSGEEQRTAKRGSHFLSSDVEAEDSIKNYSGASGDVSEDENDDDNDSSSAASPGVEDSSKKSSGFFLYSTFATISGSVEGALDFVCAGCLDDARDRKSPKTMRIV